MYVPGLRFSERVFVPPENVGVAPTTDPLLEAIVTLCISGDMFVKAIVTLPDDAVSDVVLYLSAPLGSAESFNAPPVTAEDTELAALLTAEVAEELTDEAPDEAAELTEELADEAADEMALLALEDPPQPASPVSARSRPGISRRLICISFVGNGAMCTAR